MRSHTVRSTEEYIFSCITIQFSHRVLILQTADIVYHIRVQQIICINSLTIVYINGIKFQCPVDIIIATASDRSDLVQSLNGIIDCHHTGNFPFYRCFINNRSLFNVGLWQCIDNIVNHNSNWSLKRNFRVSELTGKITVYLSVGIRSLSFSPTTFDIRTRILMPTVIVTAVLCRIFSRSSLRRITGSYALAIRFFRIRRNLVRISFIIVISGIGIRSVIVISGVGIRSVIVISGVGIRSVIIISGIGIRSIIIISGIGIRSIIIISGIRIGSVVIIFFCADLSCYQTGKCRNTK